MGPGIRRRLRRLRRRAGSLLPSRRAELARRDMAYKMFRLIWGVNLLGGLATTVVKLHQADLL
ncbi:hypothetical protein ACFQ05_32555 [Amycolatopsis umgeniensis]|uniref:Uncharacterized protein n=1 Tax=Amycolatopsis umgeniensis TaxID=336628 RepID=A0A841AU52_9PSEU|nr:hypothetical protein [Amycolatopsis umgeniensis]MBB5850517.1 hypothetical protein [Amycolatopsis umgeniensis]